MWPAKKRLYRDDRAGGEIDLRLVVELELAVLERRAEVVHEAQPVGLGVDLRVVYGVGVAAVLGAVHRQVGAAHERGRLGRVPTQGDADARPDAHGDHFEHERFADDGRDAFGDRHPVRFPAVEEKDGQLVAADAKEQVAIVEASADAGADLPQQVVTCGVPERVVHLLEVIEIDIEERQRGGCICIRLGEDW